METMGVNRRNFVLAAAGIGVGTLVPDAIAQRSNSEHGLAVNPADVAKIHTQVLNDVGQVLKGAIITENQGLRNLVAWLVDIHAISKEDAIVLYRLIELLSPERSPMDIGKEINAMYEQVLREVENEAYKVIVAIVGVAKSSADSAIKWGKNHPTTVKIIRSDLSGAISGAGTGFGLGKVPGAVMGALLMGGGASIMAAFDSAK